MPQLTMTSRERVMRAIKSQPTDVMPVGPMLMDFASVYYGITVGEFVSDAKALAEANLALYRELDHDVIFLGTDNYYIAQGFGCKAAIPDDEIPHLDEPAVEKLEDVYSLKVPNPLTDGRMPVFVEATRMIRAELGDSVAIRTPGTGPFALASCFIGTQEWLVEVGLAEAGLPEAHPEALHHALNIAADALIDFGKACFDAGADILHCGDSLASCDMISPKQYEKWAFPYQKKVISAWKAYGATTLLHICGNSTPVLDLYAQTGADLIEIDYKVDLAHAKKTLGERSAIIGNLDTVSTLLLGTEDKVREDAEKCIEDAAANGGYILGSGCMVPRTAPIENLKAMIDVARAHPNSLN